MKYILLSFSERGTDTAAPDGDTCLKEAAAGIPSTVFRSFTRAYPLSASRKLMYPGFPLSTVTGSSRPVMDIEASFWLGLSPYLSFIVFFISFLFIILDSFPTRTNSETLLSASRESHIDFESFSTSSSEISRRGGMPVNGDGGFPSSS